MSRIQRFESPSPLERQVHLERLTRLCNLNREGAPPIAVAASGFQELDAALPNGGWQSGTLVELMPDATGMGELRLLMPALAHFTRESRHIALIEPPWIPFAPALVQHGIRLEHLIVVRARQATDALWALEQTLRCGSFGAALAWPTGLEDRDIRRLQLAAEAGRSTGFLYRPPGAALQPSPAAVRIRLHARPQGRLDLEILKCRGGRSGRLIRLAPDLASAALQP